MIVREANAADAAALAAIYGHHVVHGLGTFEEQPPPPDEMERRRSSVTAYGLPYLVAAERADGGRVLGFAYAGPFRLRRAYRYTVEDSVYVAHDAVGQGIGRSLLAAVLERCAALGVRQVVALIGDSNNAASIGLHRALGFVHTGTLPSLGFKNDRWLDVVCMQRALKGGDRTPPEGEGVAFGVER